MAFMEGMAILILAAYILHIQSSTRPILGADPTGFVPEDVAGPLRWTNYVDDMTDPYYVEKDVFDNIEKVQATAARLKAVHNSSVVYINDKHTSYMGDDGNYRPLPPHKTSKGSEMYLIRALHQLHCVAVIVEGIGYPLHRVPPKWPGEHLAHCVNNLRGAVACLADTQPIARTHKAQPGQYVHTTDGQQSMCRDIHGLLQWAHDPVRRVWGKIVSPPYEEDIYEELSEHS
ncbi:hypothetical protein CSPAE12_06087 [Colletotrichum incanum]|nr:hypothetical protein CSPAE12_06087 [Colletotrichum incanum]